MTNGEKMKEIFSDIKIITQYDNPFGDRLMVFTLNNKCMQVNIDWWNAEYKEPTTKNDLGVDAVSRNAVINQIFYSADNNGDVVLGSALRERIARLPSVTQEPRKGHWINKHHLFDSCSAECSSCHKCSNGYMHDNGFSLECKYYDFCPKCGAKMESEPQESEG